MTLVTEYFNLSSSSSALSFSLPWRTLLCARSFQSTAQCLQTDILNLWRIHDWQWLPATINRVASGFHRKTLISLPIFEMGWKFAYSVFIGLFQCCSQTQLEPPHMHIHKSKLFFRQIFTFGKLVFPMTLCPWLLIVFHHVWSDFSWDTRG